MAGLLAGAACSAGEEEGGQETVAGQQPVGSAAGTFVFNAEDNRLNAYEAETGAKQTVIENAAGGGLDINAQICFHQWGGKTYFIAGEDTEQGANGSPGWGWFELGEDSAGKFTAIQHGKLVPTWSGGGVSNPENYGCGFLPDGHRMITTDVGNQLPTDEASGQLIVWFMAPSSKSSVGGFDDGTHVEVSGGQASGSVDNTIDDSYCKIDTQIATAGGSWIHDGWAYVASNRPGPNGPGGIYRYEIADFPADSACFGLGKDADLVAAGRVTRELWLPSDAFVLTPSAIAKTGRTYQGFPTWYVSSVFTGVIAEYADLGSARVWIRNVVEPPGGAPIGQADDLPENTDGTPFGIGVTPSGDLWYADMGVLGDGPADDKGSVQRVRFDSAGNVADHGIIDQGLLYPDGIGVLGAGTFASADAPAHQLDLALGRPVTCTSGAPAESLVDGDDATAATAGQNELSCIVDLEGKTALSAVRIRWGSYKYDPALVFNGCKQHDGVGEYDVYVSENAGGPWTRVAGGAGHLVQEETLNMAAGIGRYVKLEARNTNECEHVEEVGAYTFSVFGAKLL